MRLLVCGIILVAGMAVPGETFGQGASPGKNPAIHSEAIPMSHSDGQTVYVPAYSEVPFAEGKLNMPLTVTLTICNLDRGREVSVDSVEYYDSKGKLIRPKIEAPRVLKPLETLEIIVKQSDRTGGVGASFLVKWSAQTAVMPPAIETVMIGTTASQGISFVGQARVLE